jgi:hypothetical protein
MANIYALPSLTTWNTTAGGWSNTSGGTSNGRVPNATTDTVIFDANSGPARQIAVTASPQIATMVCTGASMTLTGSPITLFGAGPHDLSGFTSIPGLTVSAGGNLKLGACPITGSLLVNNASAATTLQSNLTVNGTITVQGGGGLFGNGYDVSCGTLSSFLGNDGSGGYFGSPAVLGSGTWTFTGTGTLVQIGSTLQSASSTVKISCPDAGNKSFEVSYLSSTATFWVADTGTGTLTIPSQFTIGTFKATKGSILFSTPGGSYTFTATNWQVAGTSTSYVSLASTGAASNFYAFLASPNTTTPIYLDYCKFNHVGGNVNLNFYARSWIDAGGMVNIKQFVAKPNFTAFF